MVQDSKLKSLKKSMHKDLIINTLNQNLIKGDDIIFQLAQQIIMTIDSLNQSKQFPTNKKLVLANGTSSHFLSSQSQFKPYSKEVLFSRTINNYNIETSRLRWRKISSLSGFDDQLQNESKTSHKVLQTSQNVKKLFNISLNVHSPKQISSKMSYSHDIYESYGSYSTPSIPYDHNSKYRIYNGNKVLSNSYHKTLFDSTSHVKYHMNYGAIRGGHVIDAQLNHEDNLPQYKWKGTRQLFYDYERKRYKRYGVEKEQIISTTLLQKWVPLNESKKTSNKPLVFQSGNLNTNDGGLNEKEEKMANKTSNMNVANCYLDIIKRDIVTNNNQINSTNKESNNEGSIVDNIQQLSMSNSIYNPCSSSIEEDLQIKNEITKLNSNFHTGENVGSEQNLILTNGVLILNSKELSSNDDSGNVEGSLHINKEFSNSMYQSTKIISTEGEKLQMLQICKSKVDMINAIAQHLAIGIMIDAIHFSIESREASQKNSFYAGAPIAEIEKFLFAVAPKFNLASSLTMSNNWKQENNLNDCKSNVNGFEKNELCSCHLAVPLNSIWQWYEKPSNYGLEIQAIDLFCTKSTSHTFLAYFLPYLSGIQIYGHKKISSSTDNGYVSWEILEPYIDAFKRTKQDNKKTSATFAQLIFEFFDSDPPSQRQPLFQKIDDLLHGKKKSNCQSFGNPSCLREMLLKDLHPASWFAVAWYPIYRISVGSLKSVFLTYHSFHHIAHSNTLQCLLGQTASYFDENLTFPVIGLESYNTQRENWLTMDACFESKSSIKNDKENLSTNQIKILNKRLNSLQMAATTLSRRMLSQLKHFDYDFFITRQH